MRKTELDATKPSMPLSKKIGMAAVGLLLLVGGIELYRSFHYQQQLLLTAQYEMEVAQKEAGDAKKEAEEVKQELDDVRQEAENAKQEAENARQEAEKAIQEREAALQSAVEKETSTTAAYLEGATNVNYTARVVSPDGIGVNLREGPGSSYTKVLDKPVPVGEVLTISAEKTVQNGAAWGYTQYDGLNGWVYLAELEPT